VVARDLLGCVLVTRRGGAVTAGRIVETEAYLGPQDAASHAAFRPSSRPLFYGDGGFAYVYLIYGLHACLNVVAAPVGRPGCVLIRAAEPLEGARAMARRREVSPDDPRLATGPGNLTRAFGITVADTGRDVTRGPLSIEARPDARPVRIARGPRIGITRAPTLPLRFWVRDHPCVSR